MKLMQTGGFGALKLIGGFWMFFAAVILVSTFFVQGNEFVPATRGQVANLIAGIILFGTGLMVFLAGKRNASRP